MLSPMVAVLGIGVILVGCVGDSSNSKKGGSGGHATRASTTVTTGSLTKAQFIAHANRYCRHSWTRMLKKVAAYQDEQRQAMNRRQIFRNASWRFLFPGIEFQFDQMHQILGVPAGDEHQVEEMVGAMQVAIEGGEKRLPSSARQLVQSFADYNRLADQYGVRDCLVQKARFEEIE